ncbi:DUF2793 domain-containing protein [Tsuneonella sp. HG249]
MTTPILGMPELAQSQAIPETTANEIARYLEQGAHAFSVKDKDLATPPGSPADGDAYIVAGSPTGAWTGHTGEIAWRMSTAWEFIVPVEGMLAWVQDENKLYVYQPSAWAPFVPAVDLDDITDVNAASPADGEVLTWDDGAGEWVPAPAPGSGGSAGGTVPNGGTTGQVLAKQSGVDQDVDWETPTAPWTVVHDSAVGTVANVDVTGLGGYSELIIVGRNLTASATGQRALQVSANSTWYTASGDYQFITNAGVETATNALAFHATSSALARTLVAHILNTKGSAKVCLNNNSSFIQTVFVGSANAIDGIRLTPGGAGNLTGGNLLILGR